MHYRYQRKYTGPLQAAVLDWAGTTVDYGCFAPTMVFVKGFKAHRVEVTIAEARKPMGLYKRDHIATVMAMPAVTERWIAQHGQNPTDADVDTIFQEFIPRQLATIANHNTLIPGVVDAIAAMRQRGLKIGSSTGYTAEMMAKVTPAAAEQGYAPDCLVTSDKVSKGRPAPWLIYSNMEQLSVYPVNSVVKIGDTVADIEAGLNAGTWTIGIAKTGNELGLTQQQVEALTDNELQQSLAPIYDKLYRAGAHYVVNSLTDVPAVVDAINIRLAAGENPL